MWNGTMFVDLDSPLNASSLLSASAELLVCFVYLLRFALLVFTKIALTLLAWQCEGYLTCEKTYCRHIWIFPGVFCLKVLWSLGPTSEIGTLNRTKSCDSRNGSISNVLLCCI